jgi:RNA-directed DNA polymerase
VKGKASPDDPSLQGYWQKRNTAKAKNLSPIRRRIAMRQSGICPACGEPLFNDEELQIHHMKPIREGGKGNHIDLQLLHLYCHHQIHALWKRNIV